MKRLIPIIFFVFVTCVFFAPVIINNKLPVPSDTITGLYHPFRDLYAKDYPNGIPFKNFLITDPVRQQYPWRNLVIEIEKKYELPLWNPYNFAGTPLLANFQSSPFYILNILLFIMPFYVGWSVIVILQTLLAGIFLYLYLNNLKLNRYASILGAVSFAFCGFSVAWLEWGTIVNTALWLPLLLLSTDKIFCKPEVKNSLKFKAVDNNIIWSTVFIFALTSAFFAGHLQTFFYLFLVTIAYFVFRWLEFCKSINHFLKFGSIFVIFLFITFIQWFPALNYILQSGRNIDQNWLKAGWFIPWQNLIQFVSPDFFGNPTTLNYWGVWNYSEFIGYIGIFPLIMSFFASFKWRDRLTFFFGIIFFLSLIFSLPTFFAVLPFQFHIPFLSTAQPTRLLFLTDFSLAFFAAIGLDYLIKTDFKRQILYPVSFIGIVLAGLWVFVLLENKLFPIISHNKIDVAKHNLYVPTMLFAIIAVLLCIYTFIKNKRARTALVVILLIVTLVDLFRFANKFTPFTNREYLFPQTKTLNFLQKQNKQFRIMAVDDRILPPNFSILYQLQSVSGYDPLYLLRYGELIAASERGKPDITPPFGFNRIITPHNFESKFMDLMGVRYVLSLNDIKSSKLKKVFQEGQTKVYENNLVFSRVFMVKNIVNVSNKHQAIDKMFDKQIDLKNTAIVENWDKINIGLAEGTARIMKYNENTVDILVKSKGDSFLVLTDTFYPIWHAQICDTDKNKCSKTKIYITDYNFRGVIIPKGNHKVVFYNSLL